MKKRLAFIAALTILFVSASLSVFAMGDAVNGVRNAVGGAENAVEDVGNGIVGGVRSGLNTLQGGTQNVMSGMKNGAQDAGNTVAGMTGSVTNNNNNDNNNGGYTAARTSTDEVRIAGMTTNTWTWIIVGITAAAIIILVWSYVKQRNDNDLYIDSDE